MEVNNETGSKMTEVVCQGLAASQSWDTDDSALEQEHKQKIIFEKAKLKSQEEQIEEFDTDEEEEMQKSADKNTKEIDYSKHYTYEGDTCIYTEPGTGKKLVWDAKQNAWCARDTTEGVGTDPTKNYEHDGKNYVYTDETTKLTYKFDEEKKEWVLKAKENKLSAENASEHIIGPITATPNAIYGFENDTHTYTDPSDGSVYMWDREKNAWFPKVDDDFMARYQMSYGFTDQTAESNSKPAVPLVSTKVEKEQKRLEAKRKNQEPPSWFEMDERHNTAVYVTGLPLDITMDELTELFTKCGLVARDEKGNNKIKLYKDSEGEPKGDALCTYIKVESVELALSILDGWKIRGKTLSVQRAKFQLKGEYDPAKKPKKKKKDKERQKKVQDKLLDWRPDRLPGEPLKCERVVIIKNLFKPEDFNNEVSLLLEYQQDVRSECSKCGNVTKVVLHDRHPEGIAQVSFKDPAEAQACVQLLNGRWFGQRKITAEIWDGKTKFKVAETESEIEARINKWDKYLEEQEEKREAEKKEAERKECEEAKSSVR